MSPLSFILIVASVLFLIFAIDGLQRRKFNFLHFLIFVGAPIIVLASVFYPGFQDKFASIFGVARIADGIVYVALIVLVFFYFELLHEVTKQKSQTTRLVSWLAIDQRIQGAPFANSTEEKSRFCFLIRAYHEEKSIGEVIEKIIGAGYSKIVIINDGSMDTTAHVVKEKQSKFPEASIVLISHTINRGGGAANKTGFAFLETHYKELHIERVVTFDADGQMDIADMHTFTDYIHKYPHARAFLGSRFIKGGEAENMPFGRKVILW